MLRKRAAFLARTQSQRRRREEQRGVPVLTPVTEAPGGWSAEVKDPDGHPLAFFQAEGLPRRR